MPEKQSDFFAVRADHIMWMMIIVLLFSMSIFVHLTSEIGDVKIKQERMEERVDWNEDQNVDQNKWKDRVYQEKIIGAES